MSFGRRKDGRYYPKRRRIITNYPEPADPPKKPKNHFPHYYNDDRRRKELEEFAKKRKEEWEKDERLKRLSQDELGDAKILLISAVPTIISSDPTMTLATIWTAWKFAKFSYDFVTKLDQEYKKTNNLEEALLNVTLQGVEQQILSKLKEISVKNVSEITAKSIWNYYKEKNHSFRVQVDLDRHSKMPWLELLTKS